MGVKRKSRMLIVQCLVVFFGLLTKLHADSDLSPSFCNATSYMINVGVILDLGSWTGKAINSCISMAIADFYASNNDYGTRIVLHTRDSRGYPKHAISAALDLLENIKVQAIIGPETTLETKLLAVEGDKAKVPIFSFASILSSFTLHPFLVQIKQDETSQFRGIATILRSYNWRAAIIIYEDSDDGREVLPHLIEPLQEANVHIASRTSIVPFASDDQILSELQKLLTLQPTVFIVHMSPTLASRLFQSAKRIGIMKEGYAWILTDKIMNQVHSIDSEVIIESMQGVLGLKAYIPTSEKLHNFTLRWRKALMEFRELDVLGIWAYDTIWALAESIEKLRIEFQIAAGNQGNGGLRLLNEIAQTGFTGLSGEFQILDGKLHSEAYVVVNVIGKGERRVGFWTPNDGISQELVLPLVEGRSLSSNRRGLEAVIWPGGFLDAPKGLLKLTGGKKLRIAVPINTFKELVNVYHDPQTNGTFFTGFCIDVFLAAILYLDYEVQYEFIPFVAQSWESLGSYNDLIYQVYLQKYDGIVADMTITANRSLYVDFTFPFSEVGVGTIARRGKGDADMWVFSKPLRVNLWMTSAAFFVLMGLVVWIIEHPTNHEFQGPISYQIGTILWFGFSTLVYAHSKLSAFIRILNMKKRERLTSNLSRFVVLIWLFVVLILTSSYTATLSSMLTVQQIHLASARDYVGISSPFLGGAIVNNLNFNDDRLRFYNLPQEYADALSKGSKKGGVAAIIDEIPYLKIFLEIYGPDYAMVSSQPQFATNGFGFVFQKGSLIVADLSRAIAKLREEGILERLEKKWRNSATEIVPEDTAAEPNALSLDNFTGLFLICGLSCVLALLIHLFSLLQKRFHYKIMIIKLVAGGKLAMLLRFIVHDNGNATERANIR